MAELKTSSRGRFVDMLMQGGDGGHEGSAHGNSGF